MSKTVLRLEDIKVRFRTLDGVVEAVKGVNLTVSRGETVAIVGESGSGKSQLMMGTMGLLASNGEAAGRAMFGSTNILGLPKDELNTIRGRKITMIFQEPMTSLDPLYTIGSQLLEPIMHHGKVNHVEAETRALEMLQLVKIPEAARRMGSYPHELSGGQRQRVMIAMALANNPELLIADEPTTALDVTIQAEILELMKGLQQRLGMGMIFITHDLNIVKRIAQRVYVMRNGEVVEEGDTQSIFANPQHPYTKALLEAEPTGRKSPASSSAAKVLTGTCVSLSKLVVDSCRDHRCS
jgi:oligopeptide/dipeptide ABC transporter ATP-binding protein